MWLRIRSRSPAPGAWRCWSKRDGCWNRIPWFCFRLRGLHQDDLAGLMAHLQQAQSGRRHSGGAAATSRREADLHDEFWGDMRAIRSLHRHVENRDNAEAPAYRLGPPPAADQSGNGDLALLVEAIYARARQSD